MKHGSRIISTTAKICGDVWQRGIGRVISLVGKIFGDVLQHDNIGK
ncbi:MAG: hypothetical protein IJD28_04290 [Deferribacterales bacterium]|nr:hypothetical protein [Deferribacterales bacterium]